MTRKPKTITQIAHFIQKLHRILSNSQNQEIIGWSICGKYFIIKDISRLECEILPALYRHRNLNSFIRQLNMYDFHKIRKDHIQMLCFSNPNFTQDNIEKLCQIKRKPTLKDKQNKQQDGLLNFSEDGQKIAKCQKIIKKVKFHNQIKEQANQSYRIINSSNLINGSMKSILNPESNVIISSIKQTNDQINSSFRFIDSKMSIQFNDYSLQSMNNIFYANKDQSTKDIQFQQAKFLKQRQNNSQIYYETFQFLQTQNNSRSYKINQDLQDNLSINCNEEINSIEIVHNHKQINCHKKEIKIIYYQDQAQFQQFQKNYYKINQYQSMGSLSNFMSF